MTPDEGVRRPVMPDDAEALGGKLGEMASMTGAVSSRRGAGRSTVMHDFIHLFQLRAQGPAGVESRESFLP